MAGGVSSDPLRLLSFQPISFFFSIKWPLNIFSEGREGGLDSIHQEDFDNILPIPFDRLEKEVFCLNAFCAI